MSRGNNRGNAKIIHERNAAYQNMSRSGNFIDRIKWYIELYRASKGQNNGWNVGSFRTGGKVFEAHLTIQERGD